jgi:hypothetical protein
MAVPLGELARMSSKKRSAPDVLPRFCPNCGDMADVAADERLCPLCGETSIAQGYCPVCERHWRIAVGEACPKHDLPLEPGPATPNRPILAGQSVVWVTIKSYENSLAAAVPRSRLEAEGVPTFLDGERMGSPGMYTTATNGVRLQVPADRAAEARIILSQSWSLPSDDDEKADFEDLL